MRQKNKKNSYKYIAFEGIDKSGKTTIAEKFADYLSIEYPVFLTKEPGAKSGVFRDLLLSQRWNKKTELFLFLADRADGIELIKKRLTEGIVISDRSLYSTLAYQGYGEGIDIDFLTQLNRFATDNLFPDVVFLIDIDLDTMKKRSSQADAIESKSIEFFKRVREGYLKLADRFDNFFVIDGTKTIEKVFNQVVDIWNSL